MSLGSELKAFKQVIYALDEHTVLHDILVQLLLPHTQNHRAWAQLFLKTVVKLPLGGVKVAESETGLSGSQT